MEGSREHHNPSASQHSTSGAGPSTQSSRTDRRQAPEEHECTSQPAWLKASWLGALGASQQQRPMQEQEQQHARTPQVQRFIFKRDMRTVLLKLRRSPPLQAAAAAAAAAAVAAAPEPQALGVSTLSAAAPAPAATAGQGQGQGLRPAGTATAAENATAYQQIEHLEVVQQQQLQAASVQPFAAAPGASGAAAGLGGHWQAPAAAAAPPAPPAVQAAALYPLLGPDPMQLLAPLVPLAVALAALPAAPAFWQAGTCAEVARRVVAKKNFDSMVGEDAPFLQGVREGPAIAASTAMMCTELVGTVTRIDPTMQDASGALRYDVAREVARDKEAAVEAAPMMLGSSSSLGAAVWGLHTGYVAVCIVPNPQVIGGVQFIYMGTWGSASLATQAANTAALALHGGNTDAAQGWMLQHNPLVFDEVKRLYRLP